MMAIFFLFNLRVRNEKKVVFFFTILSTALLLLFSLYGAFMMEHILFRLEGRDVFEDTNRIGIWTDALELLLSTGGVGIGVGSLGESMREIGHTVTHNVFFEILVQFGIVITLVISIFVTKIFIRFYHCSEKAIKMLGYCALISFPFFAVIDSTYMLKPQIWVFIASLYVFSSQKISRV
jgi:O-antigen ligase